MQLQRICRRRVDLARADDTVRAAAQRFSQRNVGTLVVVDEAKRPVGIVTDRDLVTRVLAMRRDPGETTVGDVMTPRPRTVGEDADPEVALSLMAAGGFRRIPVVDAEGVVTGILSLDDVLRCLVSEMVRTGQVLEAQTPEHAVV